MQFDQIVEQFSSELTDFLSTGELDWGLFIEFFNYYAKIAFKHENPSMIDPVIWVSNQINNDFAF